MIRTALLAVFASVVFLAIYLYFYLGFYKPVEIERVHGTAMHFISKSHTGPYHEIGPSITAVESWAREHHVPCEKTFGEYLDDPQAVDQDRLRSRGGCLVNGPVENLPTEFKYEDRPAREYVKAEFSGSPAIGPFKVYPLVKEYLVEKRLKSTSGVIEIYSLHGTQVDTEYLFPLD